MSRWRDRIRISGGFWLLAAWFTLVNGWQLLAVILSAAALHELGHLLVLRLLGARVRELRDTVMRLRLDAVAATGFGLSRTKAAELIASGRVQVNHRECTKGDQMLNQGDVVTARGFGKFELSQVGGQSRKGRTAIVVKRYL